MLVSKIGSASEHASRQFFENATRTIVSKIGLDKVETNEQVFHELKINAGTTKKSIERHVEERMEWCSEIFHPSMRTSVQTKVVFTPVEFNVDPRHERLGSTDDVTDLETVVADGHSIIILGDLGSGKTTTLKKIAIDVRESGGSFLFLRFRDFGEELTVFGEISRIASVQVINKRPKKMESEDSIHDYEFSSADITDVTNIALSNFLDELGVTVFLDGFDELPHDRRSFALREIEILSRNMSKGKLFLSSRPTEIRKAMPGFSVFEIEPMSRIIVKEFVQRWFSDDPKRTNSFLKALSKTPYSDVVNRPLMLTNLLIVYQKYRRLPEQPVSIYEKIVGLCLEEWDASNEIKRPTKYSQLEDRRKRDFLAGFAFALLKLNGGRLSFNLRMLERVYVNSHHKYGLPEGEFKSVAQDIQSTTGLIVQSGYDLFEFSHKSLFEFLIAEYIVRSGFDAKVYSVLENCPNEAAIAVALSSDPNQVLSLVFVRDGVPIKRDAEWVEIFIRRMMLEKPLVYRSDHLGSIAIWMQYLLCRSSSRYRAKSFFTSGPIKQSLKEAFTDSEISRLNSSLQVHLYFDASGEAHLAGFSPDEFDAAFGNFTRIAYDEP